MLFIEDYAQDFDGRDLREDALTAADWADLTTLRDYLKPFNFASNKLQADPEQGKFGALYEWLIYIDDCFTKLEYHREDEKRQQHSAHLNDMLDQAFFKLNEYYKSSDLTPAYRAAIILHPHFKLQWIRKHWSHKRAWIKEAEVQTKKLYKLYKERHDREHSQHSASQEESQLAQEIEFYKAHYDDDYDASGIFDRLEDLDEGCSDEMDRWLTTPAITCDKPLQWWRDNRHHWPILSTMAFDLFAIPATSARGERLFHSAGLTVTDERGNLSAATIEALEMVKAALKTGVATLDSVDFRRVKDPATSTPQQTSPN